MIKKSPNNTLAITFQKNQGLIKVRKCKKEKESFWRAVRGHGSIH